MKTVNCLGVLVVDALSGPLHQYPVRGRVTQVITESLRFLPGGGAANTSAALAQIGVPVTVFSKLGDDANGAFVLRHFAQLGVAIGGIRVSATDTTPFTYVGIHPDGDRTFIHTPGANRTFSPADLDRPALLRCNFLLYQDFWVLPQLDGQPAADLLAEARQHGVTTLLDECWGLGPDRNRWETVLPHADFVLPSADDMRAIYPGIGPAETIRLLQARGARHVILKMGKDGCLVAGPDARPVPVPSRATRIVDTTGAGDCFDAGFIAGLAHGLDPVAAAGIGAAAAAACIEHVGGAVGIPPYAELVRTG